MQATKQQGLRIANLIKDKDYEDLYNRVKPSSDECDDRQTLIGKKIENQMTQYQASSLIEDLLNEDVKSATLTLNNIL